MYSNKLNINIRAIISILCLFLQKEQPRSANCDKFKTNGRSLFEV